MQELRDGYEKQLLENQKEFSDMYDDKIKKLQDKLDEAKMKNATSINDVREMTTKVSALTSRNVELEASNASLQKRMAELQKEMDDLSAHMRSEMARKDAEVKNKDEQMEAMTNDYKVLMETKVAIDMEIAAYRKLLEGEEARLGLSPSASPEVAGPSRGVKRKRTFIEEEDVFEMVSEHKGLGNVVIEPLEKGSKCIKVTNKGEGDINIGGWTLSNDSNGTDVAYKFHRTTTLKSGETCAVWSADAGQEHNPPNSLVMKKEGGWVIGAQNLTTLNNKEGEQEAERKSWRKRDKAACTNQDIIEADILRTRSPSLVPSCKQESYQPPEVLLTSRRTWFAGFFMQCKFFYSSQNKKTDTFVHMLLPIHIHIYHEKRNKCEMNIVSHTNTVLVSILVILYKASNEF